MPIRQASAINVHVAGRLHLELDRTAWAEDLRRLDDAGADLLATADAVIALGRKANLAYLQRQVDRAQLATLLGDTAWPLVVLEGAAPGRPTRALVLTGRTGETLSGVEVAGDGTEVPVAGPLEALFPGDAPRAVLVPLGVVPLTDGGDAAHGHDVPPTARLWQLLVRERRDIWLVWLYAVLVGLFGLALPLGVQATIQLVQGGLLIQPLILLIVFVVAGSLASGALQIFQLSVVEVIQQRVFARLAVEFAFRVPRVRLETALGVNLPEQMNRFFEALTIQKSLSKLLTDAVAAIVTIAFGVLLLGVYNPYLSVASVTLIALLGLLLWRTGARGLATSIAESKYKYRVVHWFEEMAQALTAFKFAGRSNLALDRTDELLTGYLTYRRRHFRVIVAQSWFFVVFKTLITGLLLILGALLLQGRQITIGQFVASELVIVTVLGAIEKLIASLSTWYDVLTAVDKVGHVTDLPLDAAGGLELPTPSTGAGMAVALRDVSVTFPDAGMTALAGVSCAIAPGERVGVTGFTGAGASSLLLVTAGLVEGYAGTVTYDGLTLRDLDRGRLRGQVGQYLSQTDLFDGSIEDNVAMGRHGLGVSEVVDALAAAGLEAWVQAQPLGLRTPIINGGRALPVSVQTRLLLAQAIAGAPRLLVLDDFFTSAEPALRRRVLALLADRGRPWSVLIASRDPDILAACDRVLVLRDGGIVRSGPWAECAADPDVSRHLAPPAEAGAA